MFSKRLFITMGHMLVCPSRSLRRARDSILKIFDLNYKSLIVHYVFAVVFQNFVLCNVVLSNSF